MLAEVTVKDFALIGELALSFRPGLNIITGETGAGKSIIIEAINLLVGGRADTSRVRQGAQAAEIAGCFNLDDGREFALKRLVGRDGKTRAFISGSPATTGQLSDIGDTLLDIHGQHEHQALVRAQNHLELIDRFGGPKLGRARDIWRSALAEYRQKVQETADLQANEATRRDRLALLNWQVQELGRAGLKAGEDEDLENKVKRLKNHARVFEAVDKARRSLEDTAVDSVQTALQEIGRVADVDDAFGSILDGLGAAAANLEEARSFLRDYCRDSDYDAGRLEAYQDRLFMLSDLKKKYGLSVEGLVDYFNSAKAELSRLQASDNTAEALSRETAGLRDEASRAAAALSQARQEAAGRFVAQIEDELRDLAMASAAFTVDFNRRENDDGHDLEAESAEFFFSANAGEAPRPLAKIASGGELSRVMLAVRTVFGAADATPTLVFDEIDAGIGGQTAVKVGERLAALSRRHQVICVTHLAQIAAFADHHLAVAKTEAGGKTTMAVRPVFGPERLAELSRLGGAVNESAISVEHARELLSQAEAKKTAVTAGE